jgi:uncharacterized protein YeaO (DUF488 family)
MSKKSNKQKKQIKVQDKALYWEDLIGPSKEVRKSLIDLNASLKGIAAKFKNEIEKSEELNKIFTGIGYTVNDLTERYLTVRRSHSKDLGEGQVAYFKGKVDAENNKQIELFMNATLAYAGLANQLQVVANTSVAALVADLQKTLEGENNGKQQESRESSK